MATGTSSRRLDLGAEGAVVGACPAGGAGHEEVVEAATQGLGGPVGVVEVDVDGLEVAAQRPLGPQRGVRPVGDRDLAHGAAGQLDRLERQGHRLAGIGHQAGGLADGPLRDAERAAPRVGEGFAGGVEDVGVRRRRLGGDDDLVDVVGVAGDVDELLGHADAALTVGDGVVHLLDHRGATALEAVDDEELPQRSRAVEGVLDELGGQVVELAIGPRCRQRDVAHVEVDVEVGVVLPLGRGETAERGHHALVQAGDARHHAQQSATEASEVGGLVEHRDAAEGRVEVRVLLDVPHHRLDVAHATVAAHLADAVTRVPGGGGGTRFGHPPRVRRMAGSCPVSAAIRRGWTCA
jgi:hypothetical protein